MKFLALIVVAILLGTLSTYVIATTDGWYHDAYCFGKIDKFDPWCP